MVVFACQRDSFLKEYSTKVISCKPASIQIGNEKESTSCFEVICEDTVLFPEGGGQPYDLGDMNGIPVLKVLRKGAEAIHYLEKPVDVGSVVQQTVSWERRFDHMQQHSGQHLITAIAEIMFGYNTTAWWLGEEMSHIELDTIKLTQSEVDTIEKTVNEKILEGLSVTMKILENGDSQLDATRTRGLPKTHVGDVRIITIENIEANMCCGTHVSNLSQLQAIKLMGFEKGKKGKTNLRFLVGGRILTRLEKLHKRELEFNTLLKNGPDSHVSLVDKLIKSNKAIGKSLQAALKEYASTEITKFKSLDPKPKYFSHYRKDADMDYVNYIIREFNEPEVLLILAIGEGPEGHIVLYGPEDLVKSLGPKITELMEGKGNGKGQRFQARVNDIKSFQKAVQLCQYSFTC